MAQSVDLNKTSAEICEYLIQVEGRIKQVEVASYSILQALIEGDERFETRYQKHLRDASTEQLTDGAAHRISALQQIILALQK